MSQKIITIGGKIIHSQQLIKKGDQFLHDSDESPKSPKFEKIQKETVYSKKEDGGGLEKEISKQS